MGFWGSLFSGIKSIASAAVSIVKEGVKAVGKVLADKAVEVLTTGISILEKGLTVIETISKALGILKPEEDSEILGHMAMKADKKPEDFDSMNEYIDYLRKEIKVNKEEIEKLSPEERLARRAVGVSIQLKAIEEKKEISIPMEFWKIAIEKGLNAKEIDSIINNLKTKGISPKDFVKYIKVELDENKEKEIDSILLKTFKEIEPTMTEKDIEEKILRLQNG